MALDREELGRLRPEARLRRLRELQEEREEDTKEAEELIKRTQAELERSNEVPDIEIPDIEPVDITKMFEQPESLETTVQEESSSGEEQPSVKYVPETANPSEAYAADEHDWVSSDGRLKVEDSLIYRSEAQKSDELTPSRSSVEKIRKYTRG
ncbi:hypothetical protein GF323_02770 [Candidatus Woesearchaeota archaeon]|nr:hypothetical protein [Candidatus Woesearchaeota archaeon]